MSASEGSEKTRGRILRRVGAASSRNVVRGGESGLWRWLIPVLAILVLGLFAQRVVELRHDAEAAQDVASLAQDVNTDAVVGDPAGVRMRAGQLAALVPADADVT